MSCSCIVADGENCSDSHFQVALRYFNTRTNPRTNCPMSSVLPKLIFHNKAVAANNEENERNFDEYSKVVELNCGVGLMSWCRP